MKSEINKTLSGIFENMAGIYRYMGVEQRFRAGAYARAARVIETLPYDISDLKDKKSLDALPGIGESLANLILEFVRSGKMRLYEELKTSVPSGLIDLMDLKGLGPARLKQIYETLKIDSKDELTEALQDGRISGLKGMGPKTVSNILKSLKLHKVVEERMLLYDARQEISTLIEYLSKNKSVQKIEAAGSLRRCKETIGDFDVLVACDPEKRNGITKDFTSAEIAAQVISSGNTRSSILLRSNGRQADLRIINPNEWGSALLYFTGSKEHNIELRKLAIKLGYRLSEYGLFNQKTGKNEAGEDEASIYSKLGLQYIEPELRENTGEIQLALNNRLPKLIRASDIKGDMHIHSNWSDGLNTISELADYAMNSLKYDYIVVTDHSISSRIANGLDEDRILKQLDEIARLNKTLGKDFIKTGLEVDILKDGSPDIGDRVLKKLDWVCASIHSGFENDNTERLIRACQNPWVDCIGHPSGRLIGQREGYPVDMEKVIKAAAKSGTAMEINAQPLRMDLDDQWTRIAIRNKVDLAIGTDAHSTQELHLIGLGLSIARRAGAEASSIINTRSWKEMGGGGPFDRLRDLYFKDES